jgi:hypothetical protein
MASVKALNTISNFNQFQFETNSETSDVNREVPIETAKRLSEARPKSETTASSKILPQASSES